MIYLNHHNRKEVCVLCPELKYKERGGRPVFYPDDLTPFRLLLTDLYNLASSSDYIRDMRINEKLGTLLTLLMEQSWHPESVTVSWKKMERIEIKTIWMSITIL